MSCNGCRILRKGCSENCILRQSLEGTEYSPQAQANATLFVAKFFGRARLMSFLSSVSQSQRPALFQSLLHEACGRTVNPVTGALGFLSTGNWHVCQSAMNNVLNGRMLQPSPAAGFNNLLLHNNDDDNSILNIIIDDDLRESARDLLMTEMGHKRRKVISLLSDHDDDGLSFKATVKRRQTSPSDDQSVMTTLESSTEFLNTQQERLLQRDEDNADINVNDDHSTEDEAKLLQLFF